jgi:hypothetical protein
MERSSRALAAECSVALIWCARRAAQGVTASSEVSSTPLQPLQSLSPAERHDQQGPGVTRRVRPTQLAVDHQPEFGAVGMCPDRADRDMDALLQPPEFGDLARHAIPRWNLNRHVVELEHPVLPSGIVDRMIGSV